LSGGHRLLRAFAVLALLGALAATALLGSLWLERRTPMTLPAPTGPFAVGRARYDWADSSTLDSLAPVPGAKRELLVWIWYPASAGQSAEPDDYVPDLQRAAIERARGPVIGLLTRDLAKVHAHGIRAAAVSPRRPAYPVVIVRAGASQEIVSYSTLAEDLASHGYVVVGFDAPYRTGVVAFPDGRVIARTPANNPELAFGSPDSLRRINRLLDAWTGDIGFVLDRLQQLDVSDAPGGFTGRLDMSRVGLFGHSFGGAVVAQFCHEDDRCKAGVDVDGAPLGSVITAGIPHPFMFLLADHGKEPGSREVEAAIQSIYDRLPPKARLWVSIRGANHFFFSDDGALLKSHIVLGALRLLGIVGMDGRRQLAVTAFCLRTFFDTYLEGGEPSRLTIASPLYPEIQAAR
jgi:dienelactone hydrolase